MDILIHTHDELTMLFDRQPLLLLSLSLKVGADICFSVM